MVRVAEVLDRVPLIVRGLRRESGKQIRFSIDAGHAERYERQVGRRGVLVTFDQAKLFVSVVSDKRMYDYHWPPGQMAPHQIVKGLKALGVDLANIGE